jgi:hypothetical protein
VTTGIPRGLREFAAAGPCDAVVQRVGLDTVELVLIDAAGDWVPAVFESADRARAVGEALGAAVHDGWTEDLSMRVGTRDAWSEPQGRRRGL